MTECVQAILKFKWQKIKYFAMFHAFIYLCFLILLTLHSQLYGNKLILLCIQVFAIYHMLQEIL